jgi:gas vesicle protein
MDQKRTHSGGLSNGFVLGIIVGVVLTLLLVTKKGRRILRELTDEGLSKVNNWEELLEEKIDKRVEAIEKKEEKETDYIKEVSVMPSVTPHHTNHASMHVEEVSLKEPSYNGINGVAKKVATSGRRFFRGIPKRN